MQLTEVRYNNKKYAIIDPTLNATIKLNNGEFLYAINENEIISVDLNQIANLIKETKSDIKKPTLVEYAFINYLTKKIQQKINDSQIVSHQLPEAVYKMNEYIHSQHEFLVSMRKLDDKDEIVKNNIPKLYGYFDSVVGNHMNFKSQEKVEKIEETKQPIQKIIYPPYDEVTVTTILSNDLGENFDVEQFIDQYYENLNLEQIDLILSKFKLNENQTMLLNEKKKQLDVNTNNSNSKANLGKRKTFALPGFKENKESAFIDTLLLSFTVGIFCGIYLMYFVLTIMS